MIPTDAELGSGSCHATGPRSRSMKGTSSSKLLGRKLYNSPHTLCWTVVLKRGQPSRAWTVHAGFRSTEPRSANKQVISTTCANSSLPRVARTLQSAVAALFLFACLEKTCLIARHHSGHLVRHVRGRSANRTISQVEPDEHPGVSRSLHLTLRTRGCSSDSTC